MLMKRSTHTSKKSPSLNTNVALRNIIFVIFALIIAVTLQRLYLSIIFMNEEGSSNFTTLANITTQLLIYLFFIAGYMRRKGNSTEKLLTGSFLAVMVFLVNSILDFSLFIVLFQFPFMSNAPFSIVAMLIPLATFMIGVYLTLKVAGETHLEL